VGLLIADFSIDGDEANWQSEKIPEPTRYRVVVLTSSAHSLN
jgi:hypothetical protein